jgi:hypothetical protein
MRSNFDSPMKIEDGVAKACGDFDWGSGEQEAHVAVTISQKEGTLVGTASSPPDFASGEHEWMLEVHPSKANKKFKKGAAHAVGVIHTITDNAVEVFQWEQDIDLDPDATDDT